MSSSLLLKEHLKSGVPALKDPTEEPNPKVLRYVVYIFIFWIEE